MREGNTVAKTDTPYTHLISVSHINIVLCIILRTPRLKNNTNMYTSIELDAYTNVIIYSYTICFDLF